MTQLPSGRLPAAHRLHASTLITLVALSGCADDRAAPTAPPAVSALAALEAYDYAETALGGFGGSGGRAEGINTAGDVVGGMRDSAENVRAFLWTPAGVLTDLGTLGGPAALAQTINDQGQVGGWATVASGARHAFLWTAEGGMVDLGTMGGLHSEVHRINQQGVIVGEGLTSTGENHALMAYPGGPLVDLGTLGGTYSRADGLNELNQVVGRSTTATGQTHSFLWTAAGGMVDLGTLGGNFSGAAAIDNLGRVTGHSLLSDGRYSAFLWTADGGMVGLGSLGGTFSRGWSINALGHVGGHASDAAGIFHPFVWTPEGGMQSADTGFGYAFWINDRDQLVGASGKLLPATTGTEVVVWSPTTAVNQIPTAAFESSCVDRACTFTDLSTDADGSVAVWHWDFGDGTITQVANPEHTYAADGAYAVTLVVGDDLQAASRPAGQTVAVTGGPAAPIAAFTVTCAQLACTFTDASVDLDGSVVAWSWQFGDGATSDLSNPSHTYAEAGTHTVELIVTDDAGAASSPTTREVAVYLLTLTAVGVYTPGVGPKVTLTWSGAVGATVDVFRDGVKLGTTPNDGSLVDTTLPRRRGTYTYRLCESTVGGACAPEVSVTF
jgi:probable HAF family extracellular repeat protein